MSNEITNRVFKRIFDYSSMEQIFNEYFPQIQSEIKQGVDKVTQPYLDQIQELQKSKRCTYRAYTEIEKSKLRLKEENEKLKIELDQLNALRDELYEEIADLSDECNGTSRIVGGE